MIKTKNQQNDESLDMTQDKFQLKISKSKSGKQSIWCTFSIDTYTHTNEFASNFECAIDVISCDRYHEPMTHLTLVQRFRLYVYTTFSLRWHNTLNRIERVDLEFLYCVRIFLRSFFLFFYCEHVAWDLDSFCWFCCIFLFRSFWCNTSYAHILRAMWCKLTHSIARSFAQLSSLAKRETLFVILLINLSKAIKLFRSKHIHQSRTIERFVVRSHVYYYYS